MRESTSEMSLIVAELKSRMPPNYNPKLLMDYQRESNGWVTFSEHYWFLIMAASAILASLGLNVLQRLTGITWIWCYSVALSFAGVGVLLIFVAKLPLYRPIL
jgi:hypothetical protein